MTHKGTALPTMWPAHVIICDLDGTLYDSRGRSHFAENKMWDEFHAASVDDPPNTDVLHMLYAIDHSGAEIIAITGRDEKFREITNTWLSKHLVPIDTLLMRPDLDFRHDTEVKIDLLEGWLARTNWNKDEIAFAMDDRDRMVDAWRKYGIPCWQVRAGAF